MGRKKRRVRPSDNVIVRHWSQTPQQTRLRTDPCPSTINWPFGDDVAEVFETLDDAHFKAYCAEVRRQVRAHARTLPADRRDRFLREQEVRLAGYARDRRR